MIQPIKNDQKLILSFTRKKINENSIAPLVHNKQPACIYAYNSANNFKRFRYWKWIKMQFMSLTHFRIFYERILWSLLILLFNGCTIRYWSMVVIWRRITACISKITTISTHGLCIAWQAEYFIMSNIGDIECTFNIHNFEFKKWKETIER